MFKTLAVLIHPFCFPNFTTIVKSSKIRMIHKYMYRYCICSNKNIPSIQSTTLYYLVQLIQLKVKQIYNKIFMINI